MVGACGVEAGGIGSLAALIEEHGEALDATLQAEYGISLGDVAAGRVTFRRLRGLVEHLPLDGTALWRAQRRTYDPDKVKGGGFSPPPEWWTPERDLLASLVDVLNLRVWQAGGCKGSRPLPVDRPGHEEGRRTYRGAAMTPEEFHRVWASN